MIKISEILANHKAVMLLKFQMKWKWQTM